MWLMLRNHFMAFFGWCWATTAGSDVVALVIVLARQEGRGSRVGDQQKCWAIHIFLYYILLHPHTHRIGKIVGQVKYIFPKWWQIHVSRKYIKVTWKTNPPDEVRFKRVASSGSNSAMIWFTFSSNSVVTTCQYAIDQTTSTKIPFAYTLTYSHIKYHFQSGRKP